MSRILVVEDEPVNALLFRMILEKRAGFEVVVSESPEEIMELCRGGTIDLVIMDVSLARSRWQGRPVNGVDLCRMIRNDPTTAQVPVMLATAHAMRGDAETLLEDSGARDYVSKPIMDHGEFVNQVKRMMRKAA